MKAGDLSESEGSWRVLGTTL